MNRDDMIALIDPKTRTAVLERIRDEGYMGITGDMGACMALDDACKQASAELRGAPIANAHPLSFDELQARDGKPVWVKSTTDAFEPEWMLVCEVDSEAHTAENSLSFDNYGETWLAYTVEC